MAGIQPPVISGVDFIVTLILSVRRRRLMWPPDQVFKVIYWRFYNLYTCQITMVFCAEVEAFDP